MTQNTHKAQEPMEKKLSLYYGRAHIPENFTEILRNVDRAVQSDLEDLRDSEDLDTLRGLFPDAGEWITANENRPLYTLLICFTVCDAAELVKSVYLDKQGGKPSLFDFTETKDGKSKISEFFDHIEEREGKLVYTISIDGHRPGAMAYPLDKLNANIWGSQDEPQNGKFELTVLTGPSDAALRKKLNSKKPGIIPAVAYSIDFSTVEADFPIVKRLTGFDKRVCCAIGAIMDAGQDIMSVDEIYYSMGYTKRPNNYDREKINQSLTKMTARVKIDNSAEIKAGLKYEHFIYDGDFIVFERMTKDAGIDVKINGKDIKTAIHVFQYPRILEFARRRKQITEIPMPVLQSDKRKTEGNLAIEDYLIQRISEAKIKRQPSKILYKTMYERLGITGKTERQRMRAAAKDYMDHYQKTGWILSYSAERDGLTFEI